MTQKATAIAHPNIALIKYFGKTNEELNLPTKSSISIIMSNLTTITTVEFSKEYSKDEIYFNDQLLTNSSEQKKFERHLSLLRALASPEKQQLKAKVQSNSNFPFGTGLAASSSIFSSLTLAALTALGVSVEKKKLSTLSRRGSGSAARSIYDGFNLWHQGNGVDDESSFSEQFLPKDYWPELRMTVIIHTKKIKRVSSREGMLLAQRTSPLYQQWLLESEKDLTLIKSALQARDLEAVGEITERNCLQMHAVAFTAQPAIVYWNDKTLRIIQLVKELRMANIPCYFTIDAGAQVVLLHEEKHQKAILSHIQKHAQFEKEIITSEPGEGVKLTEKHLF